MSSENWGEILFAQAGGAAGPGGMTQFIPLLMILAVFYFLLIRPQQKRAKEHEDFVKGLKRNDKVVTNSGLFGKIVEVREKDVMLEVAPNVKVRYERSKISAKQSESKEG